MSWERLKETIRTRGVVLSLHAQQEAAVEAIGYDEIVQALLNGIIVEDYPAHRRGPCCLVYGQTDAKRDLHVVTTTTLSPALVITAYEPMAPYWTTAVTRGT